MKKNILAIYSIIGIVAGYLLRYVVTSIDENTLLLYGLIGGLVAGYLMDSRRRSSSTNSTSTKPGNSFNIPSIKDITDKVEDAVSEKSRVSRVDDASDIISRAREEIQKNLGNAVDDVESAVSGKSRVSRVDDASDLISKARDVIEKNSGSIIDDVESAVSEKSRVSRVDDASDLIARAREEIDKNTK